jgi:hypothetical protein
METNLMILAVSAIDIIQKNKLYFAREVGNTIKTQIAYALYRLY